MNAHNSSRPQQLPSEREPGEDSAVEIGLLQAELGRQEAPPGLGLDAETRTLLELTPAAANALVEQLCDAMAARLLAQGSLEVSGFGRFVLRPYRPAFPARAGVHSFVETPYLGPVDFVPAPQLIRQLDQNQADPTVVARCDALFAAVREHPDMPRGRIPQLIKSLFREATAHLIAHHHVWFPAFGVLIGTLGPRRVRLDFRGGAMRSLPGAVKPIFRATRRFVEAIPNLSVAVEPEVPVAPSPSLVAQDQDEIDDGSAL